MGEVHPCLRIILGFFFQIIFVRIAVQWSIVVIQRPYLGKLQMWIMWQGREKDLLNIQTEGLARRARLELRRTAWTASQMLPIVGV